MKIIVCIKQVPDTSEVKLDPKTNTLIRDGVPSIINPDDKSGIEAALRIKEQVGGTVTVVCMGPPQADVAIRGSRYGMRRRRSYFRKRVRRIRYTRYINNHRRWYQDS